jgi:hypothetical protein
MTSGTEQCEELFCEKDARWIFEGRACEPTPLCDDHAIEFPNHRLRRADDGLRADGGVKKKQPKPAQPVSRNLDYVRDHEGLLGLPLLCWECGDDVSSKGHEMVLLSDGYPVCRDCSDHADEVVSTSLHYGYPNNNVGLDLDEATRWYEIEDRLPVADLGGERDV